MTGAKLSVIVVTYNSLRVIRDCLQALTLGSMKPYEVIIVDNASSDGTQELIAQDFPEAILLRNTENEGFARAVNKGARSATGSHIVLLNPDAVITADALHRLTVIQAAHPRPSIIAPLISQPDGRLRIVSAGRFPTPWRMFTHYYGISRVSRNSAFEGHYLLPRHLDVLESTDWVTGAVLAITRSNWTALGGLSERWFMYAEDIDLCWRAKRSGMDVLLSSEVQATHLVGASTEEPRSKNADWVVNLLDFYRTSMRGGSFGSAVWKAVVCSGLASRALAYRIVATRHKTANDNQLWKQEAERFAAFAVALLKS